MSLYPDSNIVQAFFNKQIFYIFFFENWLGNSFLTLSDIGKKLTILSKFKSLSQFIYLFIWKQSCLRFVEVSASTIPFVNRVMCLNYFLCHSLRMSFPYSIKFFTDFICDIGIIKIFNVWFRHKMSKIGCYLRCFESLLSFFKCFICMEARIYLAVLMVTSIP